MSEAVQQQEMWVTHPWVTEGQNRIRFGICTASVAGMAEWAQFLVFVQRVEALGFDSFWKADHPMAWLDCWTVLAALAVTTSRIRLGSFVSCVAFRQPTLLARMSADVDRMSGGRLILGLGTGDFLWEFEQLGLPCPSLRERQQALEETIQIVRGVVGNAPFTYHGQQFWVTNAKLPLGPLQQPHQGSQVLHAIRYGAHDDDAKWERGDWLLEFDAPVHRDQGIVVATHAVQKIAVLDAGPAAADHGVNLMAAEFSGDVHG